MTQVANQTRIFGLDASARSRLNTVYMVMYFAGAAVGSALSTMAWERWGWNGVCGLALGLWRWRRCGTCWVGAGRRRQVEGSQCGCGRWSRFKARVWA